MNQMQLRQQMTVWENKQRVFSKVFNERASFGIFQTQKPQGALQPWWGGEFFMDVFVLRG
jgi:hypothetical protein